MDTLFAYALPIALMAVAAVLLLGLFNMLRIGSHNRSQNLMRARVLFQLVAIIVALTVLYLATAK